MDNTMQVNLLWLFHLKYRGKSVVSNRSSRILELISLIILNREKPLSRQYISYLLWPDTSEKQARTNLRNLLFKVRKKLPDAIFYLNIKKSSIQWNNESLCTLDVVEFEQSIEQAVKFGSKGNTKQQIFFLKKAVEVYRDDLLIDFYKKWIEPERYRLKKRYIYVLQTLIQLMENERSFQKAIPFAKKLIACDEYDEADYRKLKKLYTYSGLLGWFDGNAINLFPLSASERAERIAKLADGKEHVRRTVMKALKEGDAQCAAELADHLLALDENDRDAMLLKADALTVLGNQETSANGRNYYLTQAQELRENE